MIDVDSLRKYKLIKIVGHKHADFDSIVSGYLLEYVFHELGVNGIFVLQDEKEDPFFKEKFVGKLRINKAKKDDVLFLVDHTDYYEQKVVGCFDHHPTIVDVEQNYVNKPKTSCAKLIYEWAEEMGVDVPRSLTELVVYACYMDSLSFKSTKALPEDREWCKDKIKKYGMDEEEVIQFGYGLTPKSKNCEDYVKTGLKTYRFGDQKIKSSYIVTDNDDNDFYEIQNILSKELNDNIVAWCFIVHNVNSDQTRILLITKEYCLSQTINGKLLSRGNDIIPAVMNFLSAKNDGTVTNMLIERGLQISTMESCTSGLIASNITDYEGASATLKGAYITYSNESKVQNGVSQSIIDEFGVYSAETAIEMAWAAKGYADISIGITGSFGNVDPANEDSIAGEVHYRILSKGDQSPIKLVYKNMSLSRKAMKQRTTDIVLATLQAILMYQES